MSRRTIASLAGVVYVGSIVLANVFIVHGLPGATRTHFGTYTLPVGFGLVAPAGVFMAGVAFPARDLVQRAGGRWLGIAAIVVGAGVSFFVSSPTIAVASGLTFLCAESLDFAVYTPLQREHFALAVVVSGIAGSLLNAWLFLYLAGIPMSAFAGLLLGNLWIVLAAGPITYGLRRAVPSIGAAA